MVKKLLIILALFTALPLKSVSQINFESGYFINESNIRISCLIKNVDWKNNPKEFEYRLLHDSVCYIAKIEDVKEFGINDALKYIRATVNIDRSSDNIDNLSPERNPIFQEERLFIKVLVEGKATLFLYEEGNLTRFFCSLNDSSIRQLVYKSYLMDYDKIKSNKAANNIDQGFASQRDLSPNVLQNNYFKQQLFESLKCESITLSDVQNLKYNRRELERLFIRYNECASSQYIVYKPLKKTDLFNLSIRPGLKSSKLGIHNSASDFWDTDFDGEYSFRLGIEAEFIMPFNKNKWAIIVEPTYQTYQSEKTTFTESVSGGVFDSEISYQSIELPLGIRHYFFLNNVSKFFVNISFVYDYAIHSSLKFTRDNGSEINSMDIKPRFNSALGVGYKFRDKYSFEIQYQTNREILSDYLYWNSKYRTLSFVLGYSIF